MSENPEDPHHEPTGEDRTRRIDQPSTSDYSPPDQDYAQPQQDHSQPGQAYPRPDQGYPPPGQGYPPPSPPYAPGGYGYQNHYQGGYQAGYPQTGAYGPPGGYGYQTPPGAYGPRPGGDDTTMAMLAHLLGLLTWFIGPLVVYLVKKDESPYVRTQAAEALNFQLTLMIAYFISWILAFVLIGFVLMFVIWIGSIILMIIAAVAANRGENYRYPMNIRFIS